jgi:hypothetical protein
VYFTKEQLATLLARSRNEPRRNLKRYLHDVGGEGSAAELDEALAAANANKEIQRMANAIEHERVLASEHVSATLTAHLNALRAELATKMDERQMSIADVAGICNWSDDLVHSILKGDHVPSVEQLCKFAAALDSQWRLQ